MKRINRTAKKCAQNMNGNQVKIEYCPNCDSILSSSKKEEYYLACRKCGYEKIVSEDVYEAHKFELHTTPREIESRIPIIESLGKREEHVARKRKYKWE